MRTRSDSPTSSESHTSSSSNRVRRQIDEEYSEELDNSLQLEGNRAFPSDVMNNSNINNNPGPPPQPSHLAPPFLLTQQQPIELHHQQSAHVRHPAGEESHSWDRREAVTNTGGFGGAAEHQATPWVLTLYCPTLMAPSIDLRKEHEDDIDQSAAVIRIHVTADMTLDSWRQCIQQATSQYYTVAPIVGLFRKGDFGYFSLEYIWSTSSAKTYNEYWLYLPQNYRDYRRHERPIRQSLWQRLGRTGAAFAVLVVVTAIMLFVRKFTITGVVEHIPQSTTSSSATIMEALLSLPATLQHSFYDYVAWIHQVFIHQPIQDFYRHGPTWLGAWEGMPLSQICVRLSLMGDEDFWRRNMGDCQRMYQLKQEAVVRTIQPLVYLGILYVIWSMIKVEYLRRRQNQPDPNMVELYHAFHGVLRQVQRALAPPARHS